MTISVGSNLNPFNMIKNTFQEAFAGLRDLGQGINKLMQGDIKGAIGELLSGMQHLQNAQQSSGMLGAMGIANPMANQMLNMLGQGLQGFGAAIGSSMGGSNHVGSGQGQVHGGAQAQSYAAGFLDGASMANAGALPSGPQRPQSGMTAQSASGALAGYMHEKGMGAMNMNDIYKLANDKSAPPQVREAAKFMMAHPEQFAKIETNDVKGRDGISGVQNFDAAAQGKVPGLAA
jgi:hypothetical protein